jgi:hypothetical protein
MSILAVRKKTKPHQIHGKAKAMKRKIGIPYNLISVDSLRNSEGQPIGTWLLQSISSILLRIFYDEKFFYREILRFG